jgi:hypothetical protein
MHNVEIGVPVLKTRKKTTCAEASISFGAEVSGERSGD